ncbi:MAG: hypothetical protein ACH6QM_00800 [Candidatus Carsonella ruddii]
MYIIKIYNYNIYVTDSFYNFLKKNNKLKKKYKVFIKNKGNYFSQTKIFYSYYKNNIFNKLINLKNIFLIIDVMSLCFLNNTCFHYNKKILINSPFSFMNFFLENKILNKIIFLIHYVINKKLLIHNGNIKLKNFFYKEKILLITFYGNCKNCILSKKTFNNYIIKIFKKIKLIKFIKLNE